jgi:hypothetical protein
MFPELALQVALWGGVVLKASGASA